MENKFTYTYSAQEQEEIKKIRNKYLPKNQNSTVMEQIRSLDKKVEKPGTIISLIFGIIGTLVFGTGMSCALVWNQNLFVLGIIFGIVGILIAAAAYPLYFVITKKQKEKIAPVILKLTENISEK